jgi:Glyoxalase/Bleomycin resistance protein/Dioxygenase superfamily
VIATRSPRVSTPVPPFNRRERALLTAETVVASCILRIAEAVAPPPHRRRRQRHAAMLVDDLPALVGALTAAHHPVIVDETRDGRACVYVKDPFGNRIELVEPTFTRGR